MQFAWSVYLNRIDHSNKGPVYLKLSTYLLASAWKSLKPSNTDLAFCLLPRKPENSNKGIVVTIFLCNN